MKHTNLNFSVIFSDVNEVRDTLFDIQREKENWKNTIVDKIDLNKIYKNDLKSRKYYVWEKKQKKHCTIFFSNVSDGWESLMHIYTHRTQNEVISIRTNFENVEFGIHDFTYRKGNEKRIVMALKEKKWTFFQEGNPLEIENVEYYTNRKITDRINQDIIVEYLGKLGIDILDDSFFKSEKPMFFFEEYKIKNL